MAKSLYAPKERHHSNCIVHPTCAKFLSVHVVSVAYLLYHLRYESQNSVCGTSWGCKVSRTVLGHFDHDLDLWPQFLNNRVRSIAPMLFEVRI